MHRNCEVSKTYLLRAVHTSRFDYRPLLPGHQSVVSSTAFPAKNTKSLQDASMDLISCFIWNVSSSILDCMWICGLRQRTMHITVPTSDSHLQQMIAITSLTLFVASKVWLNWSALRCAARIPLWAYKVESIWAQQANTDLLIASALSYNERLQVVLLTLAKFTQVPRRSLESVYLC